MNEQKKPALLALSIAELEDWMIENGEAKYRAKQLFEQLHRGVSPDDMSNIGKKLQEKLRASFSYHLPVVEQKLVSAIDGTVKFLFDLSDENCVESVVMKYEHGNTICISSQVGCRMGCKFCASTIGGRVRDLGPDELLGQVIAAQKELGERISNIVMMGIGEPLDNYDNVIKFLLLVNCEAGLNIGYRHISLSTCGLVDRIKMLMEEDLPITLSISLHASNDGLRSELMPVNRTYPMAELIRACKDYTNKTGRRISFEYAVIQGVNDTPERAKELIGLLGGWMNHLNLIPINPTKETSFRPATKKTMQDFISRLENGGINATVRRTLGADLQAACGQLRREKQKQ